MAATSFFGGTFYAAEFFNQTGTTGDFFNGEFFDGGFFSEAAAAGAGNIGPLNIGMESPWFDWESFRKRRKKYFKDQIEARARLREQIRIALEGPEAEELRTILEPLPVDSGMPLYERVELESLTAEVLITINAFYETAVTAKELIAKTRREEDDEDVLLFGA